MIVTLPINSDKHLAPGSECLLTSHYQAPPKDFACDDVVVGVSGVVRLNCPIGSTRGCVISGALFGNGGFKWFCQGFDGGK